MNAIVAFWAHACCAAGGFLLGALVGVWLGYRFNLDIYQRGLRHASAQAIIAALSDLKLVYANSWGQMIDLKRLRDSEAKLLAAIDGSGAIANKVIRADLAVIVAATQTIGHRVDPSCPQADAINRVLDALAKL
jgi:hypothetical protein